MHLTLVVLGFAGIAMGIYLAVSNTWNPILEPLLAWGGLVLVLVGVAWPRIPTTD